MDGNYQPDGDYKGLYRIQIDFYKSDKSSIVLKYTFGKSNIYYSEENGQRIYTNFDDRFDFDPWPWRDRPKHAEIVTRFYRIYSPFGKSYRVYY